MAITRPAARVQQGNLTLYTTSLRVSDLLLPNFYDIERLDPADPGEGGFQRVLNNGRARKLADYIVRGQENHDAFLPTSILLATDKDVPFNAETNTITFSVADVGPFSVVDGQHRVEGLKMAADKNPEVLDFEVPVNIAVNLSKLAQMCHFLIVNTTQKSVDKSIEQRIYARLTAAMNVEDVPELPRWMERIVERGEDERALKIVDYLNNTPGSPWHKKIEMAGESSKKSTISQHSIVKFIIKFVLVPSNPLNAYSTEKQQKIMLNYWSVLAELLAEPNKNTVLFKYNGVELFSRFSAPFFLYLANFQDYTTTKMKSILLEVFDNLDGDNAGVGHPDWWLSGTGIAGTLNSAAFSRINSELVAALNKPSEGEISI
jgi:DGQHR domain-containing protein